MEAATINSTFEGAQLVNVRFRGVQGLHRFSQFQAKLYRPGLARQILDSSFRTNLSVCRTLRA